MTDERRLPFVLWCGTEIEADRRYLEPLNDDLAGRPPVQVSELKLYSITSGLAEAIAEHGPDGWGVARLDRSEVAAEFVRENFGISSVEYFAKGRIWYLERMG